MDPVCSALQPALPAGPTHWRRLVQDGVLGVEGQFEQNAAPQLHSTAACASSQPGAPGPKGASAIKVPILFLITFKKRIVGQGFISFIFLKAKGRRYNPVSFGVKVPEGKAQWVETRPPSLQDCCLWRACWRCPVWIKGRVFVISKKPVQTQLFLADTENAVFKEAADLLFATENEVTS